LRDESRSDISQVLVGQSARYNPGWVKGKATNTRDRDKSAGNRQDCGCKDTPRAVRSCQSRQEQRG